jgi:3-oxoadipate enol-lactonase
MPLLETTPGINLNYLLQEPENQANAELIVLIAGLAAPLSAWAAQTPSFLNAGYKVLTYDNRGVGQSSYPPGPYNIAEMANDLKALVRKLNLDCEDGRTERFHLLGISMGGMIAQEYALRWPQDIQTLTLACTYAAPGPYCSRLFGLWRDMAAQMGVKHVMRDSLLRFFTYDFITNPARKAEFEGVEQVMVRDGIEAEVFLGPLAAIENFDITKEEDVFERLGGRGAGFKTCVVAGEEDVLIPMRLTQELFETSPKEEGARWKVVKGGHGCVWEDPEGFNEAYLEFLILRA